VTKPFSSGELLARLRTTLRRSQPQAETVVFQSGQFEVDLAARIVRKNGAEVKLTPTEYSLLRLLVVHAGKVLTHRQLLTEVWGPMPSGKRIIFAYTSPICARNWRTTRSSRS
jgi:two-component system, OmpR family, KDP operon response regulator KdpE